MKQLFRLIKICDVHNPKNVRKGTDIVQPYETMLEHLDNEVQELSEATNVDAKVEELCDVISVALHMLANLQTVTGSLEYREIEKICIVKLLYRYDCSTIVEELTELHLDSEQEALYTFVIKTHEKIKDRTDKEGWRKLL